MTELDKSILEELAMKRYASINYLRCCFSEVARSTLSKRVKKMFDDNLIGRQDGLEPLTQKIEFIYYLKNKGVDVLLERSLKFASVDEIDIPRGHSAITHDLAVAWLGRLIERDAEDYLKGGWITRVKYECRRSKIFSIFHNQNFLPDALLSVDRYKQDSRQFLIEVDNSTEDKKKINRKWRDYQDYLKRHRNCLLIVVIQNSEKRLGLLLQLAGQMISRNECIFACTMPEVRTFSIFSNIWTSPEGLFRFYKNGKNKAVLRCEDIGKRDRFHLPL